MSAPEQLPALGSAELIPAVHDPLDHPLQEFFEPWREYRRQHYSKSDPGPGARKRRAVVTMVHDEAFFLPIWLRYYSRYFAPADIYVLDNDSSDGSTERNGFVRVPVSNDRVDHDWMARTLSGFQADLLGRYDVVLVADIDEIVSPLPEWGDLGAYIDRMNEEFVNPLGYEVLHLPDREPVLDPGRPILEQRGHWFANSAYDKPLLATVPMTWVPGLHRSADGRHNYDPDLRLIHLHRVDIERCRERHALRARRPWAERDAGEGWAAYNRIHEGEHFERWFFEDSGFEEVGIHIACERIPSSWAGAF